MTHRGPSRPRTRRGSCAKQRGSELLTRTGPGTPAGNLIRRFWQPVALSEELRIGSPLPVRILSEDLVLFRDDAGRAAGDTLAAP